MMSSAFPDPLKLGTLPKFIDLLLSPRRTRPIVGVTTTWSGDYRVRPEQVAAAVAGYADVVGIPTGPVTLTMEEELPPRLHIFGGELRVWFPGLNADSDPVDHPIIWTKGQTPDRLCADVARRVGATRSDPVVAQKVYEVGDRVTAKVLEVTAWGALFDIDGVSASAVTAYMAASPPRRPHDVVRPGQSVVATVGTISPTGGLRLELGGLQGDPWSLVAEQVRPGDVINVYVKRSGSKGVVVEVLPTVESFVGLQSIGDSTPGVDDVAPARVLSLDARQKGLGLSMRDIAPDHPITPVRIYADGPVYLEDPGASSQATAPVSEMARLTGLVDELSARIRELESERDALADHVRRLRERVGSAPRRRAHQMTGEDHEAASDMFSDPAAFERAMIETYERTYQYDVGDFPLGVWTVGKAFLESARALQGIKPQRIVDACVHVATDRAHLIEGLEVHPLRTGSPGSPQRQRADGFKAWRLYLQAGTPSARRLHYWVGSTDDGRRVVEFDAVGVHDEHV